MTRTVRELLQDQAAGIVGREQEKAALRRLLETGGPLVTFVYGIAGIGKSALIEAFAGEARALGVPVLRLDGRAIEPTTRGFLAALSNAVGGELRSVEAAAERLGQLGSTVVLSLDTYEVLRILDPWLRQSFVPGLPENVRVLLSGREAPMSGWPSTLGGLFSSLPLGNLSGEDAREVLRRSGADPAASVRINRLARGHPLSLKLAATALAGGREVSVDAITVKAIVEELTELYLDALDPVTRLALDAASVVRRPTLSLLAAMLPDTAPQDAFDRLRTLPFVELSHEGLVIHDTVREAVAALLRASDPDRSRRYRAAAWRQLRDEVGRAPSAELWRYTADLLYIIENPIIREAFFPTTEHQYSVETARREDHAEIEAIIRRHEPPAASALLEDWWRLAPTTFRVVRDRWGAVAGFYILGELTALPRRLVENDSIASLWLDHVRRQPVPRGQRVLFCRRGLTRDQGEALSPALAATWLDLKRFYMEMRPHLRRLYSTVRDMPSIGPTLAPLGFEPLPGPPTEIDGAAYYSAQLDFGPSSVDGWLSKLVESELLIEEESLLDAEQRQLVLDDRRIDLTPLEFELLSYLQKREGNVVRRTALLDDVWAYHGHDGGSNVVEAVVRSLRKKLGDAAWMIETVRGVGYRFNATA